MSRKMEQLEFQNPNAEQPSAGFRKRASTKLQEKSRNIGQKINRCENSYNCCLCLPISVGVKLMALKSVLSTVWIFYFLYQVCTKYEDYKYQQYWYDIGLLFGYGPHLLGNYLMLCWLFGEDSVENREGTAKAQFVNQMSILSIGYWQFLGHWVLPQLNVSERNPWLHITNDSNNWLLFLLMCLGQSIVTYYCMIVCIRFANQKSQGA